MTVMLLRSPKILFKAVCLCLPTRAANHQGRSAVNFLQFGMTVTAANQDTILSPIVALVLSIVTLFFGMADLSVDLKITIRMQTNMVDSCRWEI
jgi:hypothetical protein